MEELTKGEREKQPMNEMTLAPIRDWETMKNNYSKYGQLEAAFSKARAEVRFREMNWAEFFLTTSDR